MDQLSGPGCAVVSETYLGAWNVLRRHLAANPIKSRKKNGCIVVALPGCEAGLFEIQARWTVLAKSFCLSSLGGRKKCSR